MSYFVSCLVTLSDKAKEKKGDQEVMGNENWSKSLVMCCQIMWFKRKGAADKPIKASGVPVNLAQKKLKLISNKTYFTNTHSS